MNISSGVKAHTVHVSLVGLGGLEAHDVVDVDVSAVRVQLELPAAIDRNLAQAPSAHSDYLWAVGFGTRLLTVCIRQHSALFRMPIWDITGAPRLTLQPGI